MLSRRAIEEIQSETTQEADQRLGVSHPELYFENRCEFFQRLDAVIQAAEAHGVGLLLTIFWHIDSIAELVPHAVESGLLVPGRDFTPYPPPVIDLDGNETLAEPRSALRDPHSGTIALIHLITREFATRYKGSPAAWAWELSKETHKLVDLPNPEVAKPKEDRHWGMELQPGEADAISREDVSVAKKAFAETVQTLDPWRILSTGDSRPRPAAWINHHERGWKPNTLDQLRRILALDNLPPFDVTGIHVYAKGDLCFPIEPAALAPEADPYEPFLRRAVEAARRNGPPLLLGEWVADGDGIKPQGQEIFQGTPTQYKLDALVRVLETLQEPHSNESLEKHAYP